MTRQITVKTTLLLGAGILAMVVAGCPDPFTPAKTGESKLVAFNSASELLSYFKNQATQRTRSSRGFGLQIFAPTAAGGLAEDAANSGDGGSDSTYSTTNLQESGVDESDVFKSDGTYFYIARGDKLSVVKADPASELGEVGSLDLDVHVREMYLYGAKLLLLAQHFQAYQGGMEWGAPDIAFEIWPPYFVDSNLIVVEIDVTDPTAPVETKRTELDGTMVSSRLINDRLIAVLSIAPQLPDQPTPLAIGTMTIDDVIPDVRVGVEPGAADDMVTWDNFLRPESPDGYFMTAVVTLDAADIETIVESVAVIGSAGTIYASTEALYITDSQYDINDDYRETTAIHKFAYDSNGAAQYTASGAVLGRLLNQFSLGEDEGYLRVATHVDNFQFFGFGGDVAVAVAASGGGASDGSTGVAVSDAPGSTGASNGSQGDAVAPSEPNETVVEPEPSEPPPTSDYNAVYVLDESDGELTVVGAAENIAPNEDLYAARFLGDRGYLVTFMRIDPLFTIDLSDPTNPTVRGELVIPGYSDYLHPVDDTHLIGVGRSVAQTQWGGVEPDSVQLSLFDVSDLDNPTVVEQITLGGAWSWSEVSNNHKAFTYMPDEGRLAIPVVLNESSGDGGYVYDSWRGVVCFDVDTAEGFTELGRVESVANSTGGYYYFGGDWQRAAFIGDTLYAISPDGVAAVPMSNFADVTALELPSE